MESPSPQSCASRTGYDPTSMCAIRARVEQLKLLVGRLSGLFFRNLYDALSGQKSSSAEEAVHYSGKSHTKCIGRSIETRPDFFFESPFVRFAGLRMYVAGDSVGWPGNEPRQHG